MYRTHIENNTYSAHTHTHTHTHTHNNALRSHALTLSHKLEGNTWLGAVPELDAFDFQFLAVEADKAPSKAKEWAWLGVLRVVHEVHLREARGQR